MYIYIHTVEYTIVISIFANLLMPLASLKT